LNLFTLGSRALVIHQISPAVSSISRNETTKCHRHVKQKSMFPRRNPRLDSYRYLRSPKLKSYVHFLKINSRIFYPCNDNTIKCRVKLCS